MSDTAYISTRKGFFTLKRNGADWSISQSAFLADNCTIALHDRRDGTLYVALDHGHFGVKLHRSDDNGKSWNEIAVPVYPEVPDGEEPAKDMYGKVIPNSLKLIWTLVAGGEDQPGRLWCGTIPGGLFRSDDRGDSWNVVQSLWDNPLRRNWFGGGMDHPGIHSICVNPKNSSELLLGVSCGGVWRTQDDGITWNCIGEGMRAEYVPPEQATDMNIQDVHRLVQCPSHTDRLWVQHHNGMFRSDDGGLHWEELTDVEPSVFGFAVAVHPNDPDTAWFVPALKDEKRIPVDGKVVLVRTRDGGKTFDTLSNGLPQEHAYDIVYRHCLDVDASGEHLLFGSTTGNLWHSANQGDSWQIISQNLPPIYHVQFA